MKKLLASLVAVGFVGMATAFACPHTWDGSDCAQCGKNPDPIAVGAKKLNDYVQCIGDYAAKGAAVGAVGGGVVGTSIAPGVGTGLGAAGGFVVGGVAGAAQGVTECAGQNSSNK